MKFGLRLFILCILTATVIWGMCGCDDDNPVCPTCPDEQEMEVTHIQLVAGPVTDIQESTAYEFDLVGLIPPAPYMNGVLFIRQTNANFNNEGETIHVDIDGISFGAHHFATDNQSILRSLMIPITLSYTDLFYIADNVRAKVTLTTSVEVIDQTPEGNESSLDIWLDYDGLVPAGGN
ncbi:MAG: hypothetical protein ABFS42_13165 [Candidatus Krumholzibacteriota bacterium]